MFGICFREDLFAFAAAQEVDRVYGAIVADETDEMLVKCRLRRRLGLWGGLSTRSARG